MRQVRFSQDALLHFLRSCGGSVTNADLLIHFRPFLRDHADRERNRELFKRFVNSVARVKQEHGVSHVVLQRRFRGQGADSGGAKESRPESLPRGMRTSVRSGMRTNPAKELRAQTRQPGPVVLPALKPLRQPSPRSSSRTWTRAPDEDGTSSPGSGLSHVPLEEKEHLWLVNAASGVWPDIYSLFRDDPSLLHKRDFISGFTVLHWIAKHGDHRTDAQSSCGYTPLHIAAIHNHKNIIRLLVNKFKANVSLRDAAGKKAWFYLPPGTPPDLFQLLGAPAKAALGPTAVGETWTAPQTHPQTQKRRRQHRFSNASGQRPLIFSGDAKVKRSTSLAAFLKPKSLQKVKAEWAI
uniref:SOWAHA-C winged helix-turn-helix domain-containing protein n=1 Tax=Neogobius melanostomus TaxID=47308 RepID=A0A8C6T9W9_9GOBI